MADSSVEITAGSGTAIDTRTESTNGQHRQVMVIGDPSTNAGVAPVDATNGLAVDVKEVVPGSGATNLGKAEDAAHSSGDVGVMALSVRQNTATATSGSDGDYQPLITDTNGRLHTNSVVASGGIAAGAIAAGASSIADNEDVASADGDRGVKVLIKRLDTPANSSGTDGDYEFPQMSAGRIWTSSNITIGGTAVVGGSGTTSAGTLRVVHATDDTLGGVVYAEDTASANADKGIMVLAKRTDTLAASSGTDGDYEPLKTNSEGAAWVVANGLAYNGGTIDVTRPADTTAYTANDAWANSTSSPTSGGFTITGAARKSGGAGILTDMFITSSAVPGTLLQGEIHLFNQAVTAINDNAAWALSDADAKFRVGIVSFTLLADASNSYYHATNLNYQFVCVGSANLRYLIKVKNAYTPTSGEVLTILPKIIYID